MSVVLSIFGIGFLIFIHELGHLLAAKWTGLPVVRFSIGMGPVVLRKDAFGLEWAISLVPFGGYVMFDGESEAYQEASATAKVITSVAGPLANVLTAIVLYIGAASLAAGALTIMGGIEGCWTATVQTFDVVIQLFSGAVSVGDLAGPVHMVSIGSSLAEDPGRFLSYLGFISMNLAVLNMLPLPVLDGGQIILTVAQGLAGRPLPERIQSAMFGGSALFLVGLIVWVAVQDIRRLVS